MSLFRRKAHAKFAKRSVPLNQPSMQKDHGNHMNPKPQCQKLYSAEDTPPTGSLQECQKSTSQPSEASGEEMLNYSQYKNTAGPSLTV